MRDYQYICIAMSTGLSIKIFGSLLGFLMLPYTVLSQTQHDGFPFKNIEYIKYEKGLNGDEIFWITQDKRGFLWLATNSGPYRFDGYSFRSWPHTPGDPNSPTTASGWYTGLVEDNKNVLWFSHDLEGLFSFDQRTEKFTHYLNQPGIENSLTNNNANAVCSDHRGNIWIATRKGLDQFDPATKTFSHFADSMNSTISRTDHIRAIIPDKNNAGQKDRNFLWLVNNGLGIDYFNAQTGKVIKQFDFPFTTNYDFWKYADPNVIISEIKGDVIWLGANDSGIYGFNCLTEKFLFIKSDHICNSTGHIVGLYQVMEDHKGNLWTVTDNNELAYYNRIDQKFSYYKINRDHGIFLDYTPFFFEDDNHKIWIGTSNGLITINMEADPIFTIQQTEESAVSVSGNVFFDIYRTRQGILLAGAVPLNVIDDKTKKISAFRLPINQKNLGVYAVRDIYEDDKGLNWLSGDFGIVCYDPNTKSCRQVRIFDDSGFALNQGFRGVIQDNKARYWTINKLTGLYTFDPLTLKARRISSPEVPGYTNRGLFPPVFKDSKGIFYLSRMGGGFVTFNPDNNIFKPYQYDKNNVTSAGTESITSFIETKNGLIWFGTQGRGIGAFDPLTEKIKFFHTDNGLASNVVYSLVKDLNGKIWAGTRKGISCFIPPADIFRDDTRFLFKNYHAEDGLPKKPCNFNSAFCDADGTLYFGTRGGGIIYFHPDSLKANDFLPPVYITDLLLKNKPVPVNDSGILKMPIEFTKKIKLNYKQNIISFSFAALCYSHPEKNEYAYMLEGYDKDWIYTNASKRFANYTNLAPDNYIFKVKATNNNGVWNETPTELIVIITPPFWQTAWFRALVILVIAGSAIFFYRYRMRHILMLQKIRNKIAADLHDDIGSTLNSISVYSEVAKKDPSRRDYALSMIGESSRKIIDSMSDIVWTINPHNDSFDKIIFRMRSLTYNLLKAKKIECTFKSDEELSKINLSMEIRKNFYLIFKEALNNLVKYSEASRASVLVTFENRIVSFVIRDNGIGFDNDSLNSGNGISNMKKRAEEINAELNIESVPGVGTSIQLNLKA